MVLQENPAGLTMEGEVQDAVAIPSRCYFEVMMEFLGSVAGEMDELYVVSSGDEFKNG